MGIARFVIRAFALGAFALMLTFASVLYAAKEMRAEHLDGRSVPVPVDVAVVLASGADPDMVLGYATRRRVDAAIALVRKGQARHLIMSGGLVYGTRITLASLMRDHALAAGVPADRILIEDRSRTTFENIRFSFAIARSHGLTSRAIVTDDFHLLRAGMLARFFGTGDHALVAARGLHWQSIPIRLSAYLRETLAWWYNAGKISAWWLGTQGGLSEAELGRSIY